MAKDFSPVGYSAKIRAKRQASLEVLNFSINDSGIDVI